MMTKRTKPFLKTIQPALTAAIVLGMSSAELAAEGSAAVIVGQQSEAQTQQLSNRLDDSGFLVFSVAGENLSSILKTVVDSAQLLIYTTDEAVGRDAVSLLAELQNDDDPWFGQVAVLIDTCTTSALERPSEIDVLVYRGVGPQCEGQPELKATFGNAEDGATLRQIFADATTLTGPGPFRLNIPSQSGAEVLETVAPQQAVFLPSADGLSPQAENASFFAPLPDAQRAFIPTPSGYPEPSVYVGLRDLGDGASPPEVPEAVPDSGVRYDDVAGRNAMRISDPEGFASLLEAGAFDPPADEAARAIQAELARMKCYTSVVDGIWGKGSIASVNRYFAAAKAAAPTTAATPGLFRTIIASEDVECAVATAARAPRQPTASRPVRTRPAPPPAAPATPTGGGIAGQSVIGGFR